MGDKNIIYFEKLHSDAIIPTKGTTNSVGLDIYAIDKAIILPFGRTLISTGIKVKLPHGTYGRISPRSGLSWKYGIHLMAGVVDPDYTGELKVLLCNISTEIVYIKKHDRIAQLICEKAVFPKIATANINEITERGAKGFGSTDE